MIGTIVNTGAVLVGSTVGISVGRRLPERIRTILMQALGLSVLLIGLKMSLSGQNMIATIGYLLLGGITGELIRLEERIERVGEWLKERIRSDSASFVQGFVSASLLYLVGAMMIVGSIQDGTAGDPSTLYVKSLLDGVASVALASTFGIGVAFSALSVFVVQGCITLLASKLLFLQSPGVLNAITATGGILILGIGINLLELKTIRTGNLLPALAYAIMGGMVF
ncbi:MAG: DUF554 domain-containing protein [Deltaproteobacteria bacterium]|nr:MAG: DUF554 domain-containing protein [Deltaproteobacteria bacterium]